MPFSMWLLISFFGRIPSVITSTIGGNALGSQRYIGATVVFAITFVISVAGILVYNGIVSRHSKEKPNEIGKIEHCEETRKEDDV